MVTGGFFEDPFLQNDLLSISELIDDNAVKYCILHSSVLTSCESSLVQGIQMEELIARVVVLPNSTGTYTRPLGSVFPFA